jgi:imidazolonepropionase-like amidohydrolase
MLKRLMLSLLLLLVLLCPGAHAQVTAIKAGKLIDPEAGTTATGQIILVEGRTIKAVGAGLQIPAGATIVDLSHSTVLPGLFDAHTHLCMTMQTRRDAGNYYFTTLLDPTGYRAIQGVANARAMLESGFTTVRDVGNAGNYADTDLRRAIENRLVPGPTVVNAGRIIAPYGGQFHLQPEKRDLANPDYLFADTRDEIKKAIRENIHYGAAVIKIVVDDQRYIYSVDDIKFAVKEAGNAGLKVAAHCWTEQGAHNAAAAGVASIEHGFRMSDEALKLAKKNDVVLVSTDFTEEVAQDLGIPDAKAFHMVWVDRLRRAHKIGLPIAFGTDVIHAKAGQTRGTLAISYISSFVDAGVPARDIVKIMTANAARLLGVERQRGAIRPGQAADIIATSENPFDNILTLKAVTFVMKDGTLFKQSK